MAIDKDKHGRSAQLNDKLANDKLTPLAERFIWTDSPEKVSFAVKCLLGLCVVLFLLDFVIHRHSYLSVRGLVWFLYGGRFCCVHPNCASGKGFAEN